MQEGHFTMGADVSGPENSGSHEVTLGWDEVPTQFARVRIETSDVKTEMVLPSSQTRRLLCTIINALVAVGAIISPALTFKAVPAALPTWATVATIAGQFFVLAVVATTVRGRDEPADT
ncbi:hypothetical protein AB5J62_30765 [Amycolatopsis sp. cg5]|uniref:hypothetical protein n=1 Tax=Amycolatopsis sp. cg5 TaxID=3238802 RepID=UPI00352337F2